MPVLPVGLHTPNWLCGGQSEEKERERAGEVTFCFVDFKRICLLDHRTTAATTTKNAN